MLRAKLLGAAVLAVAARPPRAPPGHRPPSAPISSLFSGYVWRGVSLTNRPVGQPNALRRASPPGNAR